MDSPPDVFQHTLLLFKDACPPPCVYGGMTCTVAYCYTIQTQNEILTLWACEYTVTATHIYAHIRARTNRQIHVSRKSIPLLKDRLPAQLYPWLFCTFPLFCVYVCVWVLVHVCMHNRLHNTPNSRYLAPSLDCTRTHKCTHHLCFGDVSIFGRNQCRIHLTVFK